MSGIGITERDRKSDREFMLDMRDKVERKTPFPADWNQIKLKKNLIKYRERKQMTEKDALRFTEIYETWVLPTGTNSYNRKLSSSHPLTDAGYRYDAKTKSLVPTRPEILGRFKNVAKEALSFEKFKKRKAKMTPMEKRMRRNLEREEMGLPTVEDPRDFIKRMTQKGQRKRKGRPSLIQKLEDEKTVRELLEELDIEQERLDEELRNM
jgi:hypothetical protein